MTLRAREAEVGVGRFGWIFAATLLVAGAGCATMGDRAPPTFDHTVKIAFQNGCPRDVQPSAPACDKSRPQCFHAHNGQSVLFQAAQPGADPAGLAFELQFDPFKKAPLRSGSGKIPVKIDVAVGGPKTFQYNVLSGTCPPLDPQIIVDW